MLKVLNLSDDREAYFTHDDAIKAVTYCYAEENSRLSEWFSTSDLLKRFPVTCGKLSVFCGDWSAKV